MFGAVAAILMSEVIYRKELMKNWRVINNNRVQTSAKEVFLWDNKLGVAVRVAVPKKMWVGLDESFVAWIDAAPFPEGEFPAPPTQLERLTVTDSVGNKMEFTSV